MQLNLLQTSCTFRLVWRPANPRARMACPANAPAQLAPSYAQKEPGCRAMAAGLVWARREEGVAEQDVYRTLFVHYVLFPSQLVYTSFYVKEPLLAGKRYVTSKQLTLPQQTRDGLVQIACRKSLITLESFLWSQTSSSTFRKPYRGRSDNLPRHRMTWPWQ